MTTLWISWAKQDDESFRARYAQLTEEYVQEQPAENETRYMVGSSRLSESAAQMLAVEFESVVYYNQYPEGFADG